MLSEKVRNFALCTLLRKLSTNLVSELKIKFLQPHEVVEFVVSAAENSAHNWRTEKGKKKRFEKWNSGRELR